MISPTGPERDVAQAKLLMQEYSFDLSGFDTIELMAIWQERLQVEPSWIRSAVLEALYLGRYKAFSVEQILQSWQRRGHPVRHFNSEFERVVFGPIDPMASKYAAMTSLSPSELLSPQLNPREGKAIPGRESEEADGRHQSAPLPQNEDERMVATTVSQTSTAEIEPRQQALFSPETLPPESADAPSHVNAEGTDPHQNASLFNQPEPIQKFTPEPEPSEFYQRLQAVARHPD
ncbi:MAG: hypothetical protein AAF622_06990 [Cyanobacteria bacterium P01_C01_bin.147]